LKLLIKNGVIVSPEKTYRADILTENGIISLIGENISADDAEVYDADGRYVFPGGVDVHTHLNLKLGDRKVSDGFYHGTLAAAFGGTTTVVDHPEAGPANCSLHHQPDMYKKAMEQEAVVDFGIHGVFQHMSEGVLKEIPKLAEKGVVSAKVYTTYDNMLMYDDIEKIVESMDKNGCITAFHAEEDSTIKKLQAEFASKGRLKPVYHAKSRPDTSEAEAVEKIIKASEGRPVYIVHLSTAKGLDVIKKAKADGHKIFTETCPQYLLLTEEKYTKTDGAKYIMAPPLRTEKDCEALWGGLADGTIDVVATDHCSFSYKDKQKFGGGDFRKTPGGCPGVETRIPLLYSEGVAKGRISIEKFCALISANPAKIMGLYPKKGTVNTGSDADFFILDKNISKAVSSDTLHQKCDYTPFEGIQAQGWPTAVILRGKIIADNGVFYGEKGGGKFIPRTLQNKEDLI